MSIIAVEDHIVNTTKRAFKNTLRAVEVLPNALNLALLKTILPMAPAVYATFLGGRNGTVDTDGATINGRFDVYVITRHVGNDSARRRGDSTTIGAYQIIERLIPELHDSNIADIGRLRLTNVQNLFSIQLEETFKSALYALTFEVPNMPFSYQVDMDSLDNFEHFHADFDIPEFESAAEHGKWLQEPPDYDTSIPDAQDDLTELNQ